MSNGNGIIAKVQTVLLSLLIQEQLLLLMLLYECVSSNLGNKRGPRVGCCADPRCQKGLSALKFTKHEQCNKTEGERTFAKTVSERTKRWHFCTATTHFTNTSTPMLIPNSFLSSSLLHFYEWQSDINPQGGGQITLTCCCCPRLCCLLHPQLITHAAGCLKKAPICNKAFRDCITNSHCYYECQVLVTTGTVRIVKNGSILIYREYLMESIKDPHKENTD